MLMLQFLYEANLTICSCGSAALLDRKKSMLKLVEEFKNSLRTALSFLWEAGKRPVKFHVQTPDKSVEQTQWSREFAQE